MLKKPWNNSRSNNPLVLFINFYYFFNNKNKFLKNKIRVFIVTKVGNGSHFICPLVFSLRWINAYIR